MKENNFQLPVIIRIKERRKNTKIFDIPILALFIYFFNDRLVGFDCSFKSCTIKKEVKQILILCVLPLQWTELERHIASDLRQEDALNSLPGTQELDKTVLSGSCFPTGRHLSWNSETEHPWVFSGPYANSCTPDVNSKRNAFILCSSALESIKVT